MARKSFTELLADLATSFPDNTTGLITPLVIRNYFTNFLNAIRPAYALLERRTGVAQSITTSDLPLAFTSSDITSANGEMSADAAIGRISRLDKGTTRFTMTADVLPSVNTTATITFTLYRGTVTTVWAQSITTSSNVVTESVTFDAIVEDPTATDYSMRVRSTGNISYTFSNMALVAEIVPVDSY